MKDTFITVSVVVLTTVFAGCSDSTGPGGSHISADRAAAQYAVVLSNVAVNSGGGITDYDVRGDWLSSQTAGPTADYSPPTARSPHRPLVSRGLNSFGDAFEAQLRTLERTALPRPAGRAATTSQAAADRQVSLSSRDNAPAIGSTLQIKAISPSGFSGENSRICSASGYTTTTRSARPIQITGAALDRSRSRSCRDRALLRAKMAGCPLGA